MIDKERRDRVVGSNRGLEKGGVETFFAGGFFGEEGREQVGRQQTV